MRELGVALHMEISVHLVVVRGQMGHPKGVCEILLLWAERPGSRSWAGSRVVEKSLRRSCWGILGEGAGPGAQGGLEGIPRWLSVRRSPGPGPPQEALVRGLAGPGGARPRSLTPAHGPLSAGAVQHRRAAAAGPPGLHRLPARLQVSGG